MGTMVKLRSVLLSSLFPNGLKLAAYPRRSKLLREELEARRLEGDVASQGLAPQPWWCQSQPAGQAPGLNCSPLP